MVKEGSQSSVSACEFRSPPSLSYPSSFVWFAEAQGPLLLLLLRAQTLRAGFNFETRLRMIGYPNLYQLPRLLWLLLMFVHLNFHPAMFVHLNLHPNMLSYYVLNIKPHYSQVTTLLSSSPHSKL